MVSLSIHVSLRRPAAPNRDRTQILVRGHRRIRKVLLPSPAFLFARVVREIVRRLRVVTRNVDMPPTRDAIRESSVFLSQNVVP